MEEVIRIALSNKMACPKAGQIDALLMEVLIPNNGNDSREPTLTFMLWPEFGLAPRSNIVSCMDNLKGLWNL